MPPKKELCRNFQRGSCQYGDRCRFLHAAQQQSKPNQFGFGQNQQQKPNPFGFGSQNQQQQPNPFGFGSQNQQQKPNPFGFGVQNSQPRGANDFGSNQNQHKPFENKWTRSSAINNTNNSTPSQSVNQSSASTHTCTDSDSCKRQIAEDFRNERPMWRLTCYGHVKNGPCDIAGDASYEELRAAAYDEAKRGMSIQSIIEKERNLVQAKLVEFENLVSKGPSRLVPNLQNPSPSVSLNATVPLQNNVGPPSVSSFGQLAASVGTGTSSITPSTLFGQSNSFQNLNSGPPNNNTFSPVGPPNSNPIPQTNLFQNLGGNSSAFGQQSTFPSQFTPPTQQNPFTSNTASLSNGGNSSAFGQNSIFPSHPTAPTQQTPFTSNTASLGNGASGFASFAIPPQTSSSVISQPQNASIGSTLPPNAIGQSTINSQLTNSLQRESGGDDSIWMKSKWTAGEIPEEAPPDKYIF